jgi:hypothetical protein
MYEYRKGGISRAEVWDYPSPMWTLRSWKRTEISLCHCHAAYRNVPLQLLANRLLARYQLQTHYNQPRHSPLISSNIHLTNCVGKEKNR